LLCRCLTGNIKNVCLFRRCLTGNIKSESCLLAVRLAISNVWVWLLAVWLVIWNV
jgi:hypothetical protein